MLGKHLRLKQTLKRGGGLEHVPLESEDAVVAPGDEEFDREWLGRVIDLAMQRLAAERPQYSLAVTRCTIGGEPQAEVAAELGCSVQTIKNWVSRGKAKLDEFLRREVWRYSSSLDEFEAEVALLERLLPDR